MTYADGSKQKRSLKEGEIISSTTVSMDDLFCTPIVDANEGRNVAAFGVPGAYLHTDMPNYKRILMTLRGEYVDIMCHINPEYEQNVRYENGKIVLYLLVLRESYGCTEFALL